jgi:hypothetical protein
MKTFLISIMSFIVAFSAFAVGPQVVGTAHAESGSTYKAVTVAVVVTLAEEARLWLNTSYSYPLLFSERDKLVSLVQTAAKKIDIANAHETTIYYKQVLGRFYTDNAALVTVSFETDGYVSSNTVVEIMDGGNNEILMLDKEGTRDFIHALENANDLALGYQQQVALFN